MFDFGPIARTLKKNKLGAALIVLQVSLTVAILANIFPVVVAKWQKVTRPSGVDEAQLFVFSASDETTQDLTTRLDAERQRLLANPSIENASYVTSFPNGQGGWSTGVTVKPDAEEAANSVLYFADAQTANTWGIALKKGRWFTELEIENFGAETEMNPKVIVISEALAKELFPGEDALGKRVSLSPENATLDSEIIGISEDIARPWVNWGNYYHTTFVPHRTEGFGNWTVRVKPGVDPETVMPGIIESFGLADRDVVYGTLQMTFAQSTAEAYASDWVLCFMLLGFAVVLIVITILGIVGLSSFWVLQRTRMIGVRRALGAKSAQISSYFRQENFLLAGAGALIGVALAYGLNFLLSQQLGAERLSFWPVASGAILLILVGQVAVSVPAGRAAKIAPAIATRSA